MPAAPKVRPGRAVVRFKARTDTITVEVDANMPRLAAMAAYAIICSGVYVSPDEAARMALECEKVDFEHDRPEGEKWHALVMIDKPEDIWVGAKGATAWDAIKGAHDAKALHNDTHGKPA